MHHVLKPYILCSNN